MYWFWWWSELGRWLLWQFGLIEQLYFCGGGEAISSIKLYHDKIWNVKKYLFANVKISCYLIRIFLPYGYPPTMSEGIQVRKHFLYQKTKKKSTSANWYFFFHFNFYHNIKNGFRGEEIMSLSLVWQPVSA